MLRSLLAAAGCCLLLLRIPALAWQTGRATWFDVHENDLTTANCHLGWSEVSTGRFIAALADVNPLFDGSCGMCIEIRCQNANFRDGYGKSLDRSDACRNSRSIITTVADACPCEYPNNAYSNRRWCCGDDSSRPHIDITREAFNELANLRVGFEQAHCVYTMRVKEGLNKIDSLNDNHSGAVANARIE
ncbi:RlpA-like double-psi beta-barrel-protein domain-containing protein-containing protein [Dunaliella salina]|uniref:RlpA-like double-psi beta-barrel-protein domain-containing protein-containing protein n=1 Tax=Dunaliella salina TaxID=3046 RepID=A0ABQ7GMN8_DUNSA|nr:RlpA-like double-psi beta-barrel-protein domain-containing protein-containing protein [Dunaliella salina]|eukprot:KAF5835864.1 RlpA-like double-psi beta-barrel-protein domain-containing protein-containing protein [Dunaliella salina]